jgi:hypothetical protein
MKRLLLLAAVLLFAPGFASAQDAEPKQVLLKFEMSVDAGGVPTALDSLDGLPASIGQTIKQWATHNLRFEPAAIDGTPKPAATTLYLRLAPAGGDANGYKVASAYTGARLVRGHYSYQPRMPGSGYFVVDYDAKGKVASVEFDREASPKTNGEFVRWAKDLAKTFTFAPESVDGRAVGGRARVPIIFCQAERRCPKLERLQPSAGADLGGDMVATSVLTPTSDVAGDRI